MNDEDTRIPPRISGDPLERLGERSKALGPDEEPKIDKNAPAYERAKGLIEGALNQNPTGLESQEGLVTGQEADPAEARLETAESETDSPTEAVEDASETDETYTLAEVAEAIGLEASQLYAAQIAVDTGGETSEKVSIGALKDSYKELQALKANVVDGEQVQARTQELEQRQKEFEQAAQARLEAIGQVEQGHLQNQFALMEAERARQWLDGEQGQKLAQENPGQYAIQRQRVTEAIQNAQMALQTDAQNVNQVRMARFQEQVAEVVKRVPEWRNADGSENVQATKAALDEYADMVEREFGFPQAEFRAGFPSSWLNMMLVRDWASKTKLLAKADLATKEKPKQKLNLKALAAKSRESYVQGSENSFMDRLKAVQSMKKGADRKRAEHALARERLFGNR